MSDSGQLLPYSEEAEQAVLGAMLIDAVNVVDRAMNRMNLDATAFYVPANRLVAQAIFEMAESSDRALGIDILTVGEKLRMSGVLEKIGGDRYLQTLVDRCTTVVHAEYYLDIVREKFVGRRLVEVSRKIIADAFTAERPYRLLKEVPQRYLEIIDDQVREQSNAEVMDELIGEWEAAKEQDGELGPNMLRIPLPALHQLMCGLEPGLTLLAARPSEGKTTLEDCIATYEAQHGIGVFRVPLDSSRKRLMARALSRKAGVSLPKLKFGHAGASQFAQVKEARDVLAPYPMYFSDGDRELRAICTAARAMKMKFNIGLMTVDYIQQVTVSEMGRYEGNDNIRIGFVSRTLDSLSKELEIPILALSQLSRAFDKEDREPRLSDLRDSGTLEQDADKVVFLFKDRKMCKEGEKRRPRITKRIRPVWASLMKQKDGETGAVPLWLYPHYFKFEQADPEFGDAGRVGWDDEGWESKDERLAASAEDTLAQMEDQLELQNG